MEELITIPIEDGALVGDLYIPKETKGLVLFAHGSGSSRHSPRNRYVAEVLQKGGLATLLIDLLTMEEEKIDALTAHLRFDIPLLTKRLIQITDWLLKNEKTKHLKVGYFGASTGAAAALCAAAERQKEVSVVVSRGGRPDLAGASLIRVAAATLLLVGARDEGVIELNAEAFEKLSCEKKMMLIPLATHLFEEKGTLEEVAKLSRDWLISHFKR